MGGIVGYVGEGDRHLLERMIGVLTHRDPGTEEFWCNARAGMALRQPGSAQPAGLLQRRGGALLAHLGQFRGTSNGSQAEHILAEGEPVSGVSEDEFAQRIGKVPGRFVLALHDQDRDRLILGRDQVGHKCLYFCHVGHSLYFATEVKALLVVPGIQRRLNVGAVDEFIASGVNAGDRTLFEGIHKVPAGHLAFFEGKTTRIRPLPVPATEMPAGVSGGNRASQLRDHLVAAVRASASSETVGCLLSGSVESSFLAAVMREAVDARISSFTVGYPGMTSQAETVHASRVAELLDLDHHELLLIAPTSLDLIELTWFLDFPVFSPSALASSLVSGLAREHVATMFCCQGAHRLFANPDAPLEDMSGSWLGRLRDTGMAALACVGLARGNTVHWGGCQAGAGLPNRRSRWRLYSEAFRQELSRGRSARASGSLHDEWATRMDRVATAHGMKLRSPYQDPALVHWSQELVAAGLTPQGGHDLLREAAAGLLPPWALVGAGSGFHLPIREWLVGPLASFTEALLSPDYLAHQGLFCPTTVGKLLTDHESLAVDRSRELWSLLTFQLWYLTFIEDEEMATNEIGRAREKDRLPMRPPVRVAPLAGYA